MAFRPSIPDLLIADAVLPQLDGVQVATRLQENPDTTDVMIILVGTIAAARDVADPNRVIVESTKDVAQVIGTLLSRRTIASDGIVTLRRALADVRATASAPDGDSDNASTLVRARQIANSVAELMISVLVVDDDARYVEANAGSLRAERLLARGAARDDDLGSDAGATRTTGPPVVGPVQARRPVRGSYRIRWRTGETVTIRCAASANVSPGLHASAFAPARLLEGLRS